MATISAASRRSGGGCAALLQLRVPAELRGQVLSLYAVTLIGVPSPAVLGAAYLAEMSNWSTTKAVLAGGMALVVMMVLLRRWVLHAEREPIGQAG